MIAQKHISYAELQSLFWVSLSEGAQTHVSQAFIDLSTTVCIAHCKDANLNGLDIPCVSLPGLIQGQIRHELALHHQ